MTILIIICAWLLAAWLSFLSWERNTYDMFEYDPEVKAERIGRRIGLAVCVIFAPVMILLALFNYIGKRMDEV